eukprot:10943484-Alexandrium_andersonii.AAC.1
MEARRERPCRWHAGRGHAVLRPGASVGRRTPTTAAAIAARHGGRAPGHRGGRAAPGRLRCRAGR